MRNFGATWAGDAIKYFRQSMAFYDLNIALPRSKE